MLFFSNPKRFEEYTSKPARKIRLTLRFLNKRKIKVPQLSLISSGFVNNTPNYIDGYFKEFYGATSFDNKKNAIEIKRVSEEVAIEFF